MLCAVDVHNPCSTHSFYIANKLFFLKNRVESVRGVLDVNSNSDDHFDKYSRNLCAVIYLQIEI